MILLYFVAILITALLCSGTWFFIQLTTAAHSWLAYLYAPIAWVFLLSTILMLMTIYKLIVTEKNVNWPPVHLD